MSLDDGAVFETHVLDELLRWIAWQSNPPKLHFYRTHGGREVDFVLYSPNSLMAIEAKATTRADRRDSRSLLDLLENLRLHGLDKDAERFGLVVTRGREVHALAPGVWAIPDWRLFGAAA